jgi:hypothetical protein
MKHLTYTQVTGGGRKLHKENLPNIYITQNMTEDK